MAEVASLGDELKQAETLLEGVQSRLQQLLSDTPNLPHESVPEGRSENDNQEVRRWGPHTHLILNRKITSAWAKI